MLRTCFSTVPLVTNSRRCRSWNALGAQRQHLLLSSLGREPFLAKTSRRTGQRGNGIGKCTTLAVERA